MVSLPYQQCFQEFKQALESLDGCARAQADAATLKAALSDLQRFFQNRVLSLELEQLTPEMQQRVQLFLVEIDKQLRLLGMDVMFLQAARQATTTEQRRGQLQERVGILIRYCEVLLGGGGEGGGGGCEG